MYCLKCRKNAESKYSKFVKTKKGRIILLSKCAMFNSKKLKSINEQKARGFCNLKGWKVSILSDLLLTNT